MIRINLSSRYPSAVDALPLLAFVCFLVHSGCGGGGKTPKSVSPEQEKLDEIRAEVSVLRDEMSAVLGDFTPESDHSWLPQFEKLRSEVLPKLEELRKREGVEGFREVPVERTSSKMASVDLRSGKIVWRAMTCWNPDCIGQGKGGGPLLFVRKWDGAQIGPDGKIHWRILSGEALPEPTTCPRCGGRDFVRPYDSPEVEQRRQQLEEELKSARQARDEAEDAGLRAPAELRTPTEIMQELDELPKEFLLPQEEH
jgi:hypothetical protein